MKPIVVVPADDNHLEDFNKFEKSFRKYNPDIEVKRWSDPGKDAEFWFRAKPIIASKMFKDGYDTIIIADADQIVLGPLEIPEGDYDIATVLNDPTYPIQLWDITPEQPYYNNGLVVVKNPDFAKHWERLCYSSHFQRYQYREQDILNLLCSNYFNYKVLCLDFGDKLYGEVAKPVWKNARVEGDKVMIDTKQLILIHFGGGAGDASKGKYRLRFQEDVVKFIDEVLK